MAIPIKEVSATAKKNYLYPGQFIHLSNIFHDSYFYNRGVRLVGTIGCGWEYGDEKLVGNVSTSSAVLTDAFGYYLENELLDDCYTETKIQFLDQQIAYAMKRKQILLGYLGNPKVSYPLPNIGGGSETTSPIDHHSDDRVIADSININPSMKARSTSYAGCFSPADCPIASIVATKKNKTLLGMYHLGYIPVYEGVGRKLEQLLSTLKKSGFELAVFISAGAKSIDVHGEHAKWLLSAAQGDKYLESCLTTHGDDISIRLQDYAHAICDEFILPDQIEIDDTDTITAPNWYSNRAGTLGKKPNGRNAQIFCLLHE